MKNDQFRDVNRQQILYALCCDASNFTGFPSKADSIYSYIMTNSSNTSGRNKVMLGFEINEEGLIMIPKSKIVEKLIGGYQSWNFQN